MRSTSDVIVLNRMFSGDYLKQDNLGHEVINMFKADNGKCYLYLNDKGNFQLSKWRNRIKTMLLVRNSSYKGAYEIIGFATGLQDVYGVNKYDRKYIDANAITYNGVKLYDLFDKNKKKQKCYITFTAEKVYQLKKHAYIAYGENTLAPKASTIILKDVNQPLRSQKQYFSIEETANDYQTLDKWIHGLSTDDYEEVERVNDVAIHSKEDNFFTFCGIEKSELAFSNAFAYVFRKYPIVLKNLIKQYADIDISGLRITREIEDNIDLCVHTNSHLIIIENKVLSDINGVGKRKKNGLFESQLSKYHTYGRKHKGKRQSLYFLLVPNHHSIDLNLYLKGDAYRKLTYGDLRNELIALNVQDLFIQELIKAMEVHSRNFYNQLYDETQHRFAEQINRANKLNE